ncbi:MAG: serine/threonine protein kinase [Holophagaceae bacterium]|nr:serine/threonine protein kinase [Holophagaceae bacterium]
MNEQSDQPLHQKELERRILALALAEGMLPTHPDPSQTDAPTPGAPWGGALQGMLDKGLLRTEDLDRLLWRAVQQDPEGLPACPESWTMAPGPLPELDPLPGTIGPYRDLALIGTGGHGRVFRAFDDRLQRWVALKLLKAGDAELHLEEARAQARVEHPNICKVYEVGENLGRPFIALQLVAGRTLADFPMVQDTAVETIRDVAEALHAAHRTGLVHLDVKPSNILLEVQDQGQVHPLVTDFGLVALRERGGRMPSGTAPFAAPEQLDPSCPPLDRRADVYGLGATLYTLLARALPYAEREPGKLLEAIRLRPVTPLETRLPSIPKDLSRIVAKAMSTAPQDRYATALALAEDLQRYLDGEAVQAAPSTLLERSIRWRQRNPLAARVALAASLVTALGLAFGGFTLWRSSRQALAASQLGAEAKAMETSLKMEHLLPVHDLHPAYARIRNQMASLQSTIHEPAGAYAVGVAHWLLSEPAKAKPLLQRAWDGGFRSPDAALIYGDTLGQLWHEARKRADVIQDPERKKKALAQARQELLEPAKAVLASQPAQNPYAQAMLQGQTAYLDGRWQDAAAAAHRAEADRNGDPAALKLLGEAWFEIQWDEDGKGNAKPSLEASREAQAAFRRALESARSDPRLWKGLGWARASSLMTRFAAGETLGAADFEAVTETARQMDALQGPTSESFMLQGTASYVASVVNERKGDSAADERRTLDLMREAVRLDPKGLRPRKNLVFACYPVVMGLVRRQQWEEAKHLAEEGLQISRELQEQNPDLPELAVNGVYIVSALAEIGLVRDKQVEPWAGIGIEWLERARSLGGETVYAAQLRAALLHKRAQQLEATGQPTEAAFQAVWDNWKESMARFPQFSVLLASMAMDTVEQWAKSRVRRGEDPTWVLNLQEELAGTVLAKTPDDNLVKKQLADARAMKGQWSRRKQRSG